VYECPEEQGATPQSQTVWLCLWAWTVRWKAISGAQPNIPAERYSAFCIRRPDKSCTSQSPLLVPTSEGRYQRRSLDCPCGERVVISGLKRGTWTQSVLRHPSLVRVHPQVHQCGLWFCP
jgi:hypothetical protein